MDSTQNTDTPRADAENIVTPDVSVDAESHDIESTKDLIVSVIKDQSDNLEKAWREAISNILDSSGDSAWLWYDIHRTIITDNGDGIPIQDDDERKLITHMGETSKDRSDHDTIGQFGIGKGQYIAKGRVTVLTQGDALHFDINNWGVEDGARQTKIDDAVAFTEQFDEDWAEHVEEGIEKHAGGLTIVISHYEEEVPSRGYKWDRFEDQIKKRFKFTEISQNTKVYVNDERISDGEIESATSSGKATSKILDSDETGRVYIEIEHKTYNDIEVYSNGVFVRSLNTDAFSGVIVTERNLDLNFARNEIKSGCTIWNTIENEMDEIKLNICQQMTEDDLSSAAREYLAERMYHEPELREELCDMELFKATDGQYYSYNDVTGSNEIAFANPGDKYADRVSEATSAIILSDSDGAVRNFEEEFETEVETFDIEQRAEVLGLTDESREVDLNELSPRERCKLGVARELANKIGIQRVIKYGEADHMNAWTDGRDEIVITESAASSGSWNQYVTELYRILIHEWSHTEDTKENEAPHGTHFNREYRERIDSNWDALTEMIEEIDERGIRTYKASY